MITQLVKNYFVGVGVRFDRLWVGEDRHGPIDRPNLHNYTLAGILLKKVLHEKCDPLLREDRYCPVD